MPTYEVEPGLDLIQPELDKAGAGDVVLLKAGRHMVSRPIVVKRGGAIGSPLTIRGSKEAVIVGDRSPDPYEFSPPLPASNENARLPDKTDWCVFRLLGLEHVTFEGLGFEHCWPMVLYAEDTRYLRFLRNEVRGSTKAVCVRDYFYLGHESHHVIVEGNVWQQDTSYRHRLWREIDWREAHGQEDGLGSKRYFAGAFFVGVDIVGQVRFAHNKISDAWNGIVAWATRTLHDPANEAEMRRRNCDFHIFDNDFTRVRDNPVEPEGHAYNWHIRHNRIYNCHAWFSLDGVRGGLWYIYGNLGWFDERQGGPVSTTGKVLKLQEYEGLEIPLPDSPYYVFNNSWYLRCPIIPGDENAPARTRGLKFYNNVAQFCVPADYPAEKPRVCEQVPYFENFDWRSEKVSFDNNFSNHRCFPKLLRDHGQEENGRPVLPPIFEDPRQGHFAPVVGSTIIGAGRAFSIEVAGGGHIEVPAKTNAGAVQPDGSLLSVPDLEAQAVAIG
jgi:hypothetical protein